MYLKISESTKICEKQRYSKKREYPKTKIPTLRNYSKNKIFEYKRHNIQNKPKNSKNKSPSFFTGQTGILCLGALIYGEVN